MVSLHGCRSFRALNAIATAPRSACVHPSHAACAHRLARWGQRGYQARAGHADFTTTQRYINLAGVVLRAEAEPAEARILGASLAGEGSRSLGLDPRTLRRGR